MAVSARKLATRNTVLGHNGQTFGQATNVMSNILRWVRRWELLDPGWWDYVPHIYTNVMQNKNCHDDGDDLLRLQPHPQSDAGETSFDYPERLFHFYAYRTKFAVVMPLCRCS